MRHTPAAFILAVSLALLGGCGQMGPLYMPPPETTQDTAAEQADAQPQPETP